MPNSKYSAAPFERATDWVMGFYPACKELGLKFPVNGESKSEIEAIKRHNSKHMILDYGCGQGRLCVNLMRYGVKAVYGADVSPERIQTAIEYSRENRQKVGSVWHDYLMIHNDQDVNMTPEQFTGALSAFCFSIIPKDRQPLAVEALYKNLRHNGKAVLVTNNPEATGIKFAGIQFGKPDHKYESGEKMPIDFYSLVEGRPYNFGTDVFWPKEHFAEQMSDAGFRDVKVIDDLSDLVDEGCNYAGFSQRLFKTERDISPFILTVGTK